MKRQRYLVIIDMATDMPAPAAADRLSTIMARDDLSVVLQSPRSTIFASPDCVSITGQAGAPAILGTLFDRLGGTALRALPQEPMRDGTEDRVAAFAKAYWGGYVAIWRDDPGREITVFRDPSGALPCYYAKWGTRICLASDIAIMIEVGIATPTIDWKQLASHLMAVQYRSARTSLADVMELPAGSALTVTPGGSLISEIWSPWIFAKPGRSILDPKEARACVRETVNGVVKSWASCVERPLLTISGGLDSSIVAAALRSAGSDFDCLTVATSNPAGDERVEARLMAAFVDAPLHERHFDISKIDLSRSAATHLPRPTARAFGQEMDRFSLEIAGDIGADSVFHGGGGDNVFCYLHSVAPILDSLTLRGLGRSWATLRDVAQLTQTDLPTVAQATARRLWSGRRAYRWAIDTALLSEAAVAEAYPHFDHPWLRAAPNALAGAAAHIANLLAIQNYLEGYQRERVLPVIAPLLSQPLVELCLQIPSWLWIAGGINRAVARDAFVDLLPAALYRRRSKGTPDSVTCELIEANRPGIREMLLDGMLASRGLLDTARIATVLHDSRPADGNTALRILTLCDAEAWVRSVGRRDAVSG